MGKRVTKEQRRAIACTVLCPDCGALPHKPCIRSKGGARVAPHRARSQAATREQPLRSLVARVGGHDDTESPIEQKLADALAHLPGVTVDAQVPAGGYRLDFAVSRGMIDLAVECDGHEFHEKTFQQAARDKKRDRELVKMGYRVVRFTGREVSADAVACAREVLEIIEVLSGVDVV